ncbi:winged helix-turn-helix transcriptional regulator [Candidatus Woesearchaeota archaeon]|nr:winged helix-turn-helix transcriptional regulator [Candidatus Woesearchaeota archaeon]
MKESELITIYKDRIDIWNPGEFAEGFTPQDFIRQELQSVLRNPLIANCLYLTADIEKWGSGLRRITQECKTARVSVRFEVLKYGFSVVFSRWNETEGKTITEKYPEKYPGDLNATQRKMLDLIYQNNNITLKEMSALLKLSREGIKKNIRLLKEKGIIQRIGPDKGGHWKMDG